MEAFAVALRTGEPRAWAGWLAGAVSRCTSGDRLDGERVGGKWRLAFMLLRAEQRAASAEELGRQVLGVEELATLRGWLGLWAVRDGAQVVERLKVLADACTDVGDVGDAVGCRGAGGLARHGRRRHVVGRGGRCRVVVGARRAGQRVNSS
jgi:hypothetical protein